MVLDKRLYTTSFHPTDFRKFFFSKFVSLFFFSEKKFKKKIVNTCNNINKNEQAHLFFLLSEKKV